MNRHPGGLFTRLRRNRRGSVALITGGAIVALLGMAALAVDIGNVVNAKQQLQASTDAAALAGARNIGSAIDPVATAISYSSASGQKNARSILTGVTASATLKNLTTTGVTAVGTPPANAIQVTQQASVSTYFARILGINSVTISTTATASAKGGKSTPVDAIVILDTTASMNSADTSCSIQNATRLSCATAGVRALLSGFWPSVDQVGLMVFPGVTAGTVSKDYNCGNSNPTVLPYNQSPVYQIIGLVTDYKTSDTSALNPSSNLVRAVGGGGSGCSQLHAVGGVGTFYADAITAATTALQNNGRTGVQKAIILLSDGDANASASYMPTSEKNNQCHEAITAANTARTKTYWVYSVAYGASTDANSSCSTDKSQGDSISACATMQQIASDSSKFFSDTVGGSSTCTSAAHSVSELVNIFQNIGTDMTSARLIPDKTL